MKAVIPERSERRCLVAEETTRGCRALRGIGAGSALVVMLQFGFVDERVAEAAGSFGRSVVVNATAAADSESDGTASVAGAAPDVWVATWASDDPTAGVVGVNADVVFSRSTDSGATWSSPAAIYADAAVYEAGGPTIVSDGAGELVTVFQGSKFVPGTFVVRSTNQGVTWSAPVSVGSGKGLPHLATDGAGTWVTAWGTQAQLPVFDDHVKFSRSTDGGATWSPEAVLSPGDDTDGLYADDPRLATDRSGVWVAVWLVAFDGLRIARSTDNGATWGAAYAVHDPGETDESAVDIATDGSGTWIITWAAVTPDDAGDDLYAVRSTDNGATWGTVYKLDPDSPLQRGINKQRPRLLYTSAGTWLAVWNSNSSLGTVLREHLNVHVARSFDGGVTWTLPAELDPRAADETGQGAIHRNVAIGSDGPTPGSRRAVVWESDNSLNSTIGTDFDIFGSVDRDRCPMTPAAGCATTGSSDSVLSMKDGFGANNRLQWRWSHGELTTLSDLGDPTSTTDYAFCVYDLVSAGTRAVLEKDLIAGLSCARGACWSSVSTGLLYSDSGTDQGPIKKLELRPGAAGKARISLRAAGATLGLPRLPLAKSPSVRVQLINLENDKCWEATFSNAVANDPSRFKARSD